MTVTLTIEGPPTGKGRPKFRIAGKGDRQFVQVYTPQDTQKAEARIQRLWRDAGQPRLPDGPVHMRVEIVLERPQAHWNSKGDLNAAGQRSQWPTKKPDVDNVAKLVADALNGCVYRDDALIVRSDAIKRWANPGELAHTRVMLEPMYTTELRMVA